MMVRSFDRRIESLFEIHNHNVKQQAIHILEMNLQDNVNAYEMQEDGSFKHCASPAECGMDAFDIHKKFFKTTLKEALGAKLFEEMEVVSQEELEVVES